MIVKVCGMREPENIRAVERCGADWMGFILYPRSPRFVDSVPDYMPQSCKRVGVVVDMQTDDVVMAQQRFGFDIIQLHGHETPDYCQHLRQALPDGVLLMKMIAVSGADDIVRTAEYEPFVDYFLFETKTPQLGGSGTKFDWNLLNCYQGTRPFLITGGIGPDDDEELWRFSHERFAGIDINSRFETAPAMKDVRSINDFIQRIKTKKRRYNESY